MRLKKIIKYATLLTLLTSIGFLYGFSNKRNSMKKLETVIVAFESDERFFLNQSMVNKLLIQNDSSVQNQAKSVIDLYRLEEKIAKNPYIEKASLFMTIDGALHSIIKQRTPFARVIRKDKIYYLDSQGKEMPLSEHFSARVPLITGVKKDQNLKPVNHLLQKIMADDFWKKEIIGIHFNDTNDCTLTVRSGDYRIEFGKLKRTDQKLRKLKAFYSKAFSDQSIRKYKTINIQYHNQVVGVK